jgi:hypothetical protein
MSCHCRPRLSLAATVLLIALPSIPVASQAALTDGLVAYWNFDSDFSATYGGPSYDAVQHNGCAVGWAGRSSIGRGLRRDALPFPCH